MHHFAKFAPKMVDFWCKKKLLVLKALTNFLVNKIVITILITLIVIVILTM